MAETKVIVIPDGKICDYIDGKFRNDTPEEYDHEKEAYEEDQDYIQQNINTNFNPYMRKPLRLY